MSNRAMQVLNFSSNQSNRAKPAENSKDTLHEIQSIIKAQEQKNKLRQLASQQGSNPEALMKQNMIIVQEQHFCEERFKRNKKIIHAALMEKNTNTKEF
jgi:hypothetical protein